MSRTVKTEWSSPDGFHIWKRLERKARPAGRLQRLIDQEWLDLLGDPYQKDVQPITYEPAGEDTDPMWGFIPETDSVWCPVCCSVNCSED